MSRLVKFDHISVGEIEVNFMGGPKPILKAKAAFTDTKSGDTFGWTNNTHWGPVTIEKLRELRTAMESDLEQIHFDEGQTVTATKKGVAFNEGEDLGEHLRAEGDSTDQA